MTIQRIDEDLTAAQLQSALFAFKDALTEYLTLLDVVIALDGSCDCDPDKSACFRSWWPRIYRGGIHSGGGIIPISEGHILDLRQIGIQMDDDFINGYPISILPTEGVNTQPLILAGYRIGLKFFACYIDANCHSRAMKISKKMKVDASEIEESKGKIVGLITMKREETPPYLLNTIPAKTIHAMLTTDIERRKAVGKERYVILSEVIVSKAEYHSWLLKLRRITEYRLAPINPIFPSPLTIPHMFSGNILIPPDSTICLNRSLAYSDATASLQLYWQKTIIQLGLIDQEIARRQGAERQMVTLDPSKTESDKNETPELGIPEKPMASHSSGYSDPSIPYSVGEAAKIIGMSGGDISRKLKNRIEQSGGLMARLEKPDGRKYHFNRDYSPEFQKLVSLYPKK